MHNDTLRTEAINMTFGEMDNIDFDMSDTNNINFTMEDRGGCNTNYIPLTNKPQINGHTLIGNKSDEELDLEHKLNVITEQEIDRIIFG